MPKPQNFRTILKQILDNRDPTRTPQQIRTLTVDIDDPTSATPATVSVEDGECVGKVQTTGEVSHIGTLLSVTLTLNGGNAVVLSPNQLTNDSWNVVMDGARCDDCVDQNGLNKLVATADWDLNGQTVTEVDEVVFDGDCVTIPEPTESSSVSSSSVSDNSSLKPTISHRSAERVSPVNINDGWYEYSNILSSDPFSPGKLLLDEKGKPLSRKVVEVCVTCDWCHHGDPQQRFCRPIGTAIPARPGTRFGPFEFDELGQRELQDGDDHDEISSENGLPLETRLINRDGKIVFAKYQKWYILDREPYRFAQVPKGACCLCQLGSRRQPKETQHVIVATNQNDPDKFTLDPTQPIIVKFNDSFFPLGNSNSGSASLWIRAVPVDSRDDDPRPPVRRAKTPTAARNPK